MCSLCHGFDGSSKGFSRLRGKYTDKKEFEHLTNGLPNLSDFNGIFLKEVRFLSPREYQA